MTMAHGGLMASTIAPGAAWALRCGDRYTTTRRQPAGKKGVSPPQ